MDDYFMDDRDHVEYVVTKFVGKDYDRRYFSNLDEAITAARIAYDGAHEVNLYAILGLDGKYRVKLLDSNGTGSLLGAGMNKVEF